MISLWASTEYCRLATCEKDYKLILIMTSNIFIVLQSSSLSTNLMCNTKQRYTDRHHQPMQKRIGECHRRHHAKRLSIFCYPYAPISCLLSHLSNMCHDHSLKSRSPDLSVHSFTLTSLQGQHGSNSIFFVVF